MNAAKIYIGTAGWTIPKDYGSYFPATGSHLERYAQEFNAVEINSSFYRDHKPATYARWRMSVPPDFKFAVKLSRYFTHDRRLQETGERLRSVLSGPLELGERLGPLLVQVPPSLRFESATATDFFGELRRLYSGALAFEPRHLSWTTPEAVRLFRNFAISKVLADPEPCPLSGGNLMNSELVYSRLHGSPEIYRSNYEEERLVKIADDLNARIPTAREIWCIFDNTTFGFATANARELSRRLPQ